VKIYLERKIFGLKFDLKKIDFSQWVPVLVALVALVGVIFIVADWDQIQTAVTEANWKPIPYALLATLISYACISVSFAKVSQLLGVNMQVKELSIVGFISSALNHLILSGGAAGYSVRFMLMNRYGVSMREVVTISILHFYLTSLMMISMLPVSLIILSLNAPLSQTTAILLAAIGLSLLLVTILTTSLIFNSKIRKRVIRFLVRTIDTITHRDIKAPLQRFDATMDQGVQEMREQPFTMILIAILIVIDWAFSAVALWFCFRAFDITPSLSQLISGFVIGTMAGVASVLPGGLGVQEASMTGIFALYGISFEIAALVAILYRVVYTIIPYLISLGFYRLVLKPERDKESAIQKEADYENPYA
jgi:uncharacterized protein (TIRG00374 family)